MAGRELPAGTRESIQKLESMQSQAQQIAQQKAQVKNRINSVEQSLEKLSEVEEDCRIYEMVGELLIEADSREQVVSGLEERREDLDMRLSSLERKEKQVSENFRDLQEQVKKELQGSGMDLGGGQLQ